MIKKLLGVARVNFLSLTVVCIALAAAASWYEGAPFQPQRLVLVLALGLCAHISVNAFNEYFDFKSGLDMLTHRTPFSGGSGTLVAHPDASQLTLNLAVASLLALIVGGSYLAFTLGWQLLWFGVPGVLLIFGYTQYINRWPWLCLLAPGAGFGLLMTLGAYWVLADSLDLVAVVLSVIVTLLVSNLLLLNQFPDVDADRRAGRRHLPITIGRRSSAVVYTVQASSAYILLLIAVLLNVLPWQCLLAMLTLPLLAKLLPGIFRFAVQPAELIPYLAMNVALCHLFPILLMTGLIWAA